MHLVEAATAAEARARQRAAAQSLLPELTGFTDLLDEASVPGPQQSFFAADTRS
jgi:hypothetical protein